MAGYCTLTEISNEVNEDALLSIADPDQTGSVDQEYVQSAIDSCAAKIDAYISALISLPLTSPYPPVLVTINTDLAVYTLFSRNMSVPESWDTRFRAAMDFLNLCISNPSSVILSSLLSASPVTGTPLYYSRSDLVVGDLIDAF